MIILDKVYNIILKFYIENKNKKRYSLLIIFLFLITRIYFLNNYIYNIDELEWIYCVNRCKEFVLFDSHTSGPLAIYVITLFNLLFSENNIFNLHLFIIVIQLVILLYSFILFDRKYLLLNSLSLIYLFTINKSDFIAYNTEWILLLFLPILIYLNGISKKYKILIFVNCVMIFILPFIKFQFLLISLYFYIFQLKKIKNNSDLIKLNVSYFLLFILFLIFIDFNKINIFFNNYILKNLWYAYSFSDRTFYRSFIIFLSSLPNILFPFQVSLLITCLVLEYKNINLINYLYTKILLSKVNHYFFLLLVSSLTIVIPKTNFDHYFIILFCPLVYLSSFILNRNNSLSFIATIIISFVVIFNTYERRINPIKKWGYTQQISLNKIINHKIIINNNNEYDLKSLDSIIILNLNLSKIKNTVFITGWEKSQILYYRYSKLLKSTTPSSNTFYLHKKSKHNLFSELKSLNSSFKNENGLPFFFLMTNEFKFKEFKYFSKLLTNKYSIIFKSQFFILYKLN